MTEHKWKVEYIDEDYYTNIQGVENESHGFYKIMFEGIMYGMFGKTALDNKNTEEILMLIEQMLNDAHRLADNKDSNQ